MSGIRLATDGRFLVAPLCLVIAAVVFALLIPEFATFANAGNVLAQMWVLALLAVGQMFALLARGFDISVGAVAALASTVAALAMNQFGPAGLVFGALAGLACGVVNGVLVGALAIQPIIATLGMFVGARGLALLITDGGQAVPLADAGLAAYLAYGTVLGLPPVAWIALVLVIGAGLILNRSVLGRRIVMLGSNPDGAWLVGIYPARIYAAAYGLCGLFAGFAGLLITIRAGTGLPTEGTGMELQAIAAAVIGGTSLAGGVGRVSGVVIGAAFVQVLFTGLNLAGISPFLAGVAVGVVIIGSGLLEFALRRLFSPLEQNRRLA
jgi:ribose transport system permease protein